MDDPLSNLPTSSRPLSIISNVGVPNVMPVTEASYRLAIIGEAPGEEEEAYKIPFVGKSGRFLDRILSGCGIARSACFIGNVCKHRPPGNDITEFGFNHEHVLRGWEELQTELRAFAPNCILALGNTPLYFLTGHSGITSWRGSILPTAYGKVVPSLHPAYILRGKYKEHIFLAFDANRARQEAESSTLHLPQRTFELYLTADEICSRLDNWPSDVELSFDIEGGLDAWPCCSVVDHPNTGFIIAFARYNPTDQGRVYQSLSRVLYRPDVPKVLQNSLYDRFVLAYGYQMLIRNVRQDTMLKHWEIYSEASGGGEETSNTKKKGTGKGLGVITSIWTREPHYKSDLMIYTQAELKRQQEAGTYNPDAALENKYKGCVLDSCVTLEASRAMDNALTETARRHYNFNVSLLDAFLYMELKGFNYDTATARNELQNVNTALAESASRLALRVGYDLRGKKGSISSLKLSKLLYQEKGYPVQKKGRGPTAKITSDVEALLNLGKKFPKDPILGEVLLHRKLESIRETLEVACDPDGRVRCGYNLVGTETGRITCYTSPTGSGTNLQTITKKLRKLYRADPGYYLFQCDLAGADGWTVAAHCLRHGDPQMWEDYNNGLKPAKIVALMYEHGVEATHCSVEELIDRCRGVDQDGWLYFGCKRIQHATNYGVKAPTGCAQIMKDSYKLTGTPIFVTQSTFETLQRFYFLRYSGLYQWHEEYKSLVFNGHNQTSASGHLRKFFGPRQAWSNKLKRMEVDHDTWKEFLANEPQENTTYATNLAMHKLWHDPTNRDADSRLVIQPLHQVHDALIGQFPQASVDSSIAKIRSYFNNPLRIANVEVVIPFEGAYGSSWGELTTGKI